jgi:hypothetical protein
LIFCVISLSKCTIIRSTYLFISGGNKEMSSIFADQKRPRNTSPNAGKGGGGGLLGLSQLAGLLKVFLEGSGVLNR